MLNHLECAPRLVGFALRIEHARLADVCERRERTLVPERCEPLIRGEGIIEFSGALQIGRERMCRAGAQRMLRIFFEEFLERRRRRLRLASLVQFIGELQMREPGGSFAKWDGVPS